VLVLVLRCLLNVGAAPALPTGADTEVIAREFAEHQLNPLHCALTINTAHYSISTAHLSLDIDIVGGTKLQYPNLQPRLRQRQATPDSPSTHILHHGLATLELESVRRGRCQEDRRRRFRIAIADQPQEVLRGTRYLLRVPGQEQHPRQHKHKVRERKGRDLLLAVRQGVREELRTQLGECCSTRGLDDEGGSRLTRT
jgi:hypothetical protein